jgi:hypothetical protein
MLDTRREQVQDDNKKFDRISWINYIRQYLANRSSSPFAQFILQHKVMSMAFLVIAIITSYMIFSELHTATYVWQITELGPSVRPVKRSTCRFASSIGKFVLMHGTLQQRND